MLTTENTNGLIDNSEPFEVSLKETKMTWSREEEKREKRKCTSKFRNN